MKRPHPLRLVLPILWLFSGRAEAQDRKATEKITREFTIGGDAGRQVLAVYNIFGSVKVEGYAGNKVLLEATKTISADNAAALETGQKEAQLGMLQRNDSVVVYHSGPQDSRPGRNQRQESHKRSYSYAFDFVLKVPYAMNLHLATVNGNEVSVQDVSGTLSAHNVNGAITIKNAKGSTQARTVNGDVRVSYAAVPPGPSSYKTINGDIVAAYPRNTSANVHFKSLHGELYTDFAQAELLPGQVVRNQEQEGRGTRYKISKNTGMRLGKGGNDLSFETLNGDVTIKQQAQ